MQAWKHNESWSASCSSYNRPVDGDESQQLNFPYILQVSLVSKLYRDTRTVDHWHNFGVAELAFIFTEIPKIHWMCSFSQLLSSEWRLRVGSGRTGCGQPAEPSSASTSPPGCCREQRGVPHLPRLHPEKMSPTTNLTDCFIYQWKHDHRCIIYCL